MKKVSLGLENSIKRMRKAVFLAEMERLVPWAAPVELVTPYAPGSQRSRPPFSVQTVLRIHFMQQWFTLSDPTMEEAPLLRRQDLLLKAGTAGNVNDVVEANAPLHGEEADVFGDTSYQGGHGKVRYRGLRKNTAQVVTLFALSNLWMLRKKLKVLDGKIRPRMVRTG